MDDQTTTWKEAEPRPLAKATRLEVARGVCRIVAIAVITAVLLTVFALGKGLQRLLGRRVTFHYAAARFWSRGMLAILGLKPRVSGAPIRRGGVLISNHASWADILALRSVTRINFVAKAEVRGWLGVGAIAAFCGTVFIKRRRTEAKRQQADLLARIRDDELLCIFAEGTSTDGLRVLPFKSTLMSVVFLEGVHERAMVQPVSVVYRTRPKSGLPVNFYGWWGSMSLEGHIWNVATRSSGGVVEVVFHESMRAADWTDRKALTAKCEADVRSAFSAAFPGVDPG